ALEELHGDVGRAQLPIAPRVEDLGDVLRLGRADGARFAVEAGDLPFLLRAPGEDDLDRDAPPGAHVPGLVDGAHAALAELPNDRVPVVEGAPDHSVSSRGGRC